MGSGIAVSWLTITSGRTSLTAFIVDSVSSASATTGSAPSSRSAPARSADRLAAATWCPASPSWRTSGRPTAPVAPATKTLTP
jgi:hypothetical protein